jgi:hypothetical protein
LRIEAVDAAPYQLRNRRAVPCRATFGLRDADISTCARDRAPAFARLFVLAWSCSRTVIPSGSSFELERILAVLIALGAALSLSNEESFR